MLEGGRSGKEIEKSLATQMVGPGFFFGGRDCEKVLIFNDVSVV
jgi:hypothetical protein